MEGRKGGKWWEKELERESARVRVLIDRGKRERSEIVRQGGM